MKKITGLWENCTNNGERYLSVNFGIRRLMIFKNKFKQLGSNQPDYVMYITKGEPLSETALDKIKKRFPTEYTFIKALNKMRGI